MVPLLLYIIHTFETPKQMISDNAGCLSSTEAKQFQKHHGLFTTDTSARPPQGNGKLEQDNGVLKKILTRAMLDAINEPLTKKLFRAVTIYD